MHPDREGVLHAGIFGNFVITQRLRAAIVVAIPEYIAGVVHQFDADAHQLPLLFHHRLHVLAQFALVGDVAQHQFNTVLVADAVAIAVHPAGGIQQLLGLFRIIGIRLEGVGLVGRGAIPDR